MSASSWLQKQRKSELLELAGNVGLSLEDGLNKKEIESELESYLKSHPALSTDTRVAPFFNSRRAASSPVKKEAKETLQNVAEVGEKVLKTAKRRVTKAAEELSNAVANATDDSEIDTDSLAARTRQLTRTPRHAASSALSFASSVPLPPSPSVVADVIDRRTAVVRRRISRAYEDSGMLETAQTAREQLSSVVSVEALIVAFEAWCLRGELLADRYAFTVPAIPLLKTHAHAVHIPDLFLLLTSSFWGPATLWAITSFIVPLLAAYFFNLTSKPRTGRAHTQHFNYTFDPLTFNVVKGLLTYVVYQQDYTFGGWVDLESVARINSALVGGPFGVLTGCAIGVLVTFYEAIIRK